MGSERLTALDLFCGVGGMSLGFEQAGWNVLAAFDVEERNVKAYNNNFPGEHCHAADLSAETGKSLRKVAGLSKVDIDLVFGGPPCQGFSVGGKRELDDSRNTLVFEFGRLVRELRPRYFVMENVQGLTFQHARPVLEKFLREMKASKYEIVDPPRVLDAAHFGVPQRRRRLFVVGYLRGETPPTYPTPNQTQDNESCKLPPLVRDAIADLPEIELHDELYSIDIFDGVLAAATSDYARILRGDLQDSGDRSARRAVGSLTGCLRTKHSTKSAKRFAKTRPGGTESVSRYIRLAWDGVAPTIRAGTNADHGKHTAPRPIHPDKPRCITAREAARLHSFPDWFVFHGTRWHDFRQIGNSVPPLLARAVASAVLNAASTTKSESACRHR